MNEKTLKKRFDKMEKTLYKKVFLKNPNIHDVLKEGLKKHIKFIIFSNIRFTIMHNCFIKAREENLFNEDLSELSRNISQICIYLDEIIKIVDEILTTKK